MPGAYDDVPIVPQVPIVGPNVDAASRGPKPPRDDAPAPPAKSSQRPLWQYIVGTVLVAKLLKPKMRIW